MFSVADVDAALSRAVQLGATVMEGVSETDYTRSVSVRDPQGAVVTLSQYRGPA